MKAQETQARLAEDEERRLTRQQTEEAAARRARTALGAGRASLLLDDVGITEDERAPARTLGG